MNPSLRALHLRFGLRQRCAVIALVDLGDHAPLVDVLVVGDGHRGDVARDLWRDRELARRDEGVVGRLEMRGLIPVEVSGRRRQQERDEADRRQDRMSAEEAFARFFAGLLPLRVWLLAGFALLLGGLRRALGLFRWLRRAIGRGPRVARRSQQGDNVPPGTSGRRTSTRRSRVPIGFRRARVLVQGLASVLIPARHGQNSPTGAPRTI
jgi:hypothetical protein